MPFGPLERLRVAFDEIEAEEWPAGATAWPRVEGYGGEWRVHCVSDLHTDMKENRDWLSRHASPREADGCQHCLVVAGDVATKLEVVGETLAVLRGLYDAVFYVPGNHELWYVGVGGTHEPLAYAEALAVHEGRPPTRDSLAKFVAVLRLCRRLGVRTAPASLSDALHVCPFFSWYRDTLVDDGSPPSPQELGFDAGCGWPAALVAPGDAGSFRGGVADAMLRFNDRRATAAWAPPTGTVVTFSHFLPRRECYRGYRALAKVMGDPKLDAQLRAVRTAVHACGHSHMDFDATHDGVRYVQRAFGYPHERYGPFAGPLALDRACASCPPC